MGTLFEEDEEIEQTLTEEQAKRLIQWVVKHGHSKEDAYEALAYVMNATVE